MQVAISFEMASARFLAPLVKERRVGTTPGEKKHKATYGLSFLE
jgi:hypothetical protein